MLMAAIEKVPLSQVAEQLNPELSPNDGMTEYTMLYFSAQ